MYSRHPFRTFASRLRHLLQPARPHRLRRDAVEVLEQRIAPALVALVPNMPETPGTTLQGNTAGLLSGTVLSAVDSPFTDTTQPTPFATGLLRSFVVDRDPTAGVALDFVYQLVNSSGAPVDSTKEFFRLKTTGGFENALSVGNTNSLSGLVAGAGSLFNIGSYTQGAALKIAATADRDVGTVGSVGFDFPVQPPAPDIGDVHNIAVGESSAFLVVRTNATTFTTVNTAISGASTSFAPALAPVNPFTVTTTLDVVNSGDGVLSLREAIIGANGAPGPDTITFNIPGGGVKTIALAATLPAITDAVVINGYSQPGASKNTNAPGLGSNAVLTIALDGVGVSDGTADGLHITAGGSTISGLVIERFLANGISLDTAGGNVITGNFIGTDPTGLVARPNGGAGISIGGATGNTIGGLAADTANVIAFNGGDGVRVVSGLGHAIRGNAIHGNTGLGIDLGANGVTPNDAGDADSGANGLQNFPVITSVVRTAGGATITGTYNSTPSATFNLDFYSGSADASSFGEGRVFLGTKPVTTDATGNVSYLFTFTTPVAVELLVNGDFEQPVVPGTAQQFNSPSSAITGWSITSGSVDIVTVSSDSKPVSGKQSVDLVGSGPGVMEQTIATVPGEQYVLTLRYANNAFSGGTTSADITVLGTAQLATQSVSHGTSTSANMDYRLVTVPFVADSAVTKVRLAATSANNFGGIVVDAVSVVAKDLFTATATSATSGTSEFSRAAALATTFIWDAGAGADTSWFNPINWNLDSGVPGAADTAILDTARAIDLSASTSVGTFQQSSGMIGGAGAATFTVLKSFVWSGGQVGVATNIGSGATLDFSGSANKTLSGATLTVQGGAAAHWSGTGNIQMLNSATIDNRGDFLIQNSASLVRANAGGPLFHNLPGGTLTKTASGGTSTFTDVIFTNDGTVRAQTGTLAFNAGFTQNAGLTELIGGNLASSTGFTFNGGALNGSGTITGSVVNNGATVRPGGPVPAAIAADSINLGTLTGANGFKLRGVADGDRAGSSVRYAGDVNGDGFGDLIIGADRADEGGNNRGASYVVFGKAGGFGSSLDLSALDGSNGFKMSGLADNDLFGRSVSAAGDVNGDGIDDLIIGADLADEGDFDRGASYVIFGKDTAVAGNFPPVLALSALDGSNGFKLSGVAFRDSAGNSVSGAGDVNGDGFADLIIGAPYADEGGSNRAASYVVFGKAGGFGAVLALSALDGSNGFKLIGVADEDRTGQSVSAAGDVNGDGFDDLVIGARLADEGGTDRGVGYVVFGKAGGFSAAMALSALDGSNGFKLSGVADNDLAGISIRGAGDVNGDGFADLVIGARGADEGGTDRGASYVVFGKAGGFGAALALSALDGSNGFKLSGVANSDLSGHRVSGAGVCLCAGHTHGDFRRGLGYQFHPLQSGRSDA